MRRFFWLEENSPGSIRRFRLVRNPGKTGASDDTAVRYDDTDGWARIDRRQSALTDAAIGKGAF